ncbi:Fc.00g105100.m01.CDS01 [Cosmosporella sp. VM-42]
MGINFKQVVEYVAPTAKKEDDGRDKWPSRASFVLAAMGGAVGLGNLLRFPSVVFANNGLQWFIPYYISLVFLGIPVLLLEIAIGQAYRGSVVVAFGGMNKRTKGVGFAVIITGYVVCTYYVPILAWIMHYFRCSFQSPLPWTGRGTEFYMHDVIANPEPIPAATSSDFIQYPGKGLISETVGWTAFMWFLVWLCMFNGVGTTGRVVYVTMGLPVLLIIILIGQAASLDNAIDGIKIYVGQWHGEKLASGGIWQAACGQTFFSIGVGFGYFTSYASYVSKHSNAVQDSLIIACCNSLYEVSAGFAVFSVIGNLGYSPNDPSVSLSTFTVGFLTYPLALAKMPGANVWSVIFFFTLAILGMSSAFALLESLVTLLCDSSIGRKHGRPLIASVVVIISFLLSLIYCTEFGFYLLDAIDTWTNNLALVFTVWCECVTSMTLYRYKDVCGQVGITAYTTFSASYILSMVLGVAVGQAVGPEAGAGVGFGIFVVGSVVAVLLSKTPDSIAPRFWGKKMWLSKFWWLAFYSCNQLRRDLNVAVAGNGKWSIPIFWGVVLRYISAPILSIVVSFAYPAFTKKRQDPLQVFAFVIAHCIMTITAIGFIVPRWFDVFIPAEKRHSSDTIYAPQVTMAVLGVPEGEDVEETGASSHENESKQ